MRELVLDEMLESNLEILAQARLQIRVEPRRERLEHAPPEAGVADLVGVDPREQIAKLAVRHLEALGADERDRDGLAQAADAEHVAKRRFEWRARVLVRRVRVSLAQVRDGEAAERL